MKDPRAKLLILVLFSAEMTHTAQPITLLCGALLTSLIWIHPSLRKTLGDFLKTFLPSAVVYGLLAWAFQGPGFAAKAVLRFGVLLAGPWVYFQTTQAESLYQTFIWLRPPRTWSFTLALSRQFLQILATDLSEIRQNVQARGLPLDRPLVGLIYLPRFLLPVLVSSFRTAEQLAETLETRGLAFIPKPSLQFRWTWKDSLWSVVGLSLFGLGWLYG